MDGPDCFEWRVELTAARWTRVALGRREAGADNSPGALRADETKIGR